MIRQWRIYEEETKEKQGQGLPPVAESLILAETTALLIVYTLILAITYRADVGAYFLVFVGCLALSAAWLLITEVALIANTLIELAGREIRPVVNRAIQLIGGIVFLAGSLAEARGRK